MDDEVHYQDNSPDSHHQSHKFASQVTKILHNPTQLRLESKLDLQHEEQEQEEEEEESEVDFLDGRHIAPEDDEVTFDGNDDDDDLEHDQDIDDLESDASYEPLLKYQRLGGQVPEVLETQYATCIAASDRLVVVGTLEGQVHVFDVRGHEIRLIRPHMDRVNCVDINADSTHICSTCEDGSVVIIDLFGDEKQSFIFKKCPITAMSLHPGYPENGKFIATGSRVNHPLHVNTFNFFGHSKTKIPKGDSPIYACKWSNQSLLAWGNRSCVMIYDYDSGKPVASVPRPQNAPAPQLHNCCLCWEPDSDTLIIGWGECVQIVCVESPDQYSSSSSRSVISVGSNAPRELRFVGMFFLEYYTIAGVAPFDGHVAILAIPNDSEHLEDDEEHSDEFDAKDIHRRPPEILLATADGPINSRDAIPVSGYETLTADAYRMAYYYDPKSQGRDNMYYIMTPKDIVVAQLRDIDDHIDYLLSKEMFKEALEEADKKRLELQRYELIEVAERYLQYLMDCDLYGEAASVCDQFFGNDADRWENWIAIFADEKHCKELASVVPRGAPLLDSVSYGYILCEFLVSDHEEFLDLIKTWQPEIYDLRAMINAVQNEYYSTMSTPLLESLALLFTHNRDYIEALDRYLELRDETAFDIIHRHHLYEVLSDKILPLMRLNSKRSKCSASQLFLDNRGLTPTDEVITALEGHDKLQCRYLDEILQAGETIGPENQKKLVRLCMMLVNNYLMILDAFHDPEKLLPFFKSGNDILIEDALEVCQRQNLIDEQVFLLGRMGRTNEALSLIMDDEKGDIEKAIKFVEEHKDRDLWKKLVDRSLTNAKYVAGLLDYVGQSSFVNPLDLINRIPAGMKIDDVKNRMFKIVTDYSLEARLRKGTMTILKKDCMELLRRYNVMLKKGMVVTAEDPCPICGRSLRPTDDTESMDLTAFFCGHKYHRVCSSDKRCGICDTQVQKEKMRSQAKRARRRGRVKRSRQ